MKTNSHTFIHWKAAGLAASFFILLILTLISCKKDEDNDNPEPPPGEAWEMEVTFNITEPATYSFNANCDIDVAQSGNNVTISGTYTIGDLSYDDLVFEGVLNGDQFTLSTNAYQVQYEFDGTTYTEDISMVVPPFTFAGGTASGGGDIDIVTNPGNSVESGTFSFTANKKN